MSEAAHRSLSAHPLFEALPQDDLRSLASACRQRSLGKGEMLFSQGDAADHFFLVLYGRFNVLKISPRGEQHILHVHEEGDLVAEAAAFDGEAYPASCEAAADASVLSIPSREFGALIDKRPAVARKLLAAYSRRLRSFVAAIEELTLRNTAERLARYLLENAKCQDGEHKVHLRIPKKELACVLGTVPETLSRALTRFRNEGLLRESGSLIVIVDPPALRKMLTG